MSKAIRKILDKEYLSLQLVESIGNDGKPHYAYVLIERSRKEEFEQMIAKGHSNFNGIGTIIASGEGIPPEGMTETVLAKIKKK